MNTSREAKMLTAARAVYDSASARLSSTEDKDFPKVAAIYLTAAEALDELEPAAAKPGATDEFTQRRVERDSRVSEAQAALRAAAAERSQPRD